MPVLISAYLLTYDGLRNKWYIKWIFRLSVGVYLLMQLLQVTGVCYYLDMPPLIHLLFILILAGLIASFLDLLKSDQEKKDFSIYKATGLLAVFGMADIAWFYLVPSGRVAIFMRIGILILSAIWDVGRSDRWEICGCRKQNRSFIISLPFRIF